MLRGLFARRGGDGRPDAEPVKHLVRSVLAGCASAAGLELTVSEIACLDPSCPGTETVILVMQPGRRTRAAKIGKPIPEITEQDVRSALVAAGIEVS